tara:strand:+ start:543 stop:932 length:390 start_codon:yes stop_codon:yes gene_type:complete
MGFKFAKSEVELSYKGTAYTLKVDMRLSVDLERHMNSNPLNLALEINKCSVAGKVPPLGQMAEFFEFMLKRAGCLNVDFNEVYSAMYDSEDNDKVAETIGEILGLFMPQVDEVETENPKPKPVPRKKKA